MIMNSGKKFLSDLKLHSDYLKWREEDSRFETWEEACESIMDGHKEKYSYVGDKLDKLYDLSLKLMKEKAVLASQRNLQFRGPQIKKHNTKLYNCFEESTSFITNKGVKSFKDFESGDKCVVKTHTGSWKNATVKSYGKQDLYQVEFSKGSHKHYEFVTKDHRWILKDGKETTSLKVGDKLYQLEDTFKDFIWEDAADIEKLYWCYGLVYGDGTVDKNGYSKIRLCNNDIKYENRFLELGFSSSSSASIKGDVIVFTGKYQKTIPDLEKDSPELIRAFVHGYLCADGEKNRNPSGKQFNGIQSSQEDHIDFIRKAFPVAGVYILNEEDFTNQKTNFGTRPHTIKFSTYEGARSSYDKPWTITDIEFYNNKTVWCLEVEDDHSFVLASGIVTGNCTSTYVAYNKVFQDIFYLGLSGCGVGGGLLLPFVNNISAIQQRTKGTKTFFIDDSIEGWADSLGILMSSFFVDNQPFPEYAGYQIKFDYSFIRPKGTFISGGFKAPGPEGLKAALEKIESLLNNWIQTQGNKLRPIAVFDIICHASDAVLSGGVRRSALNMIVDPNDKEMIYAKTGNWRVENPQRARSNNSVLLLRNQVTKQQFEELVHLNEGDSDIGFVFANSWFDMFNPCFEIAKIPMLYDEQRNLSSYTYEEIPEFVRTHSQYFGVQGCNLTEINAETCKTSEDFINACAAASVIGTLQAGYTHFPYLGEVTEKIFKKEALIGVSVTGWMNNPMLFNEKLLEEGAQTVKDYNKLTAEIIGINQAARTTCVKPSGNASVVLGTASGIHPEHAERYFRVMQLNKENDSAKWLEEHMSFLLEESVWSASQSDYVVFVPIENPSNGLFKKDMKGVKHLELIKFVQKHWVNAGTNKELCTYPEINHNTSNTVIVDNKEEIINYIWENRKDFTAVSFMSDYGDKDFNQAPFTSVSSLEEIVSNYGRGALFVSGLIVDGLHYFSEDLWKACDVVRDKTILLTGTREQVLLKKYWIRRVKQFAKNFFNGDVQKTIHCIKDVHLLHKWEVINRQFKPVDFSKILTKPKFKEVSHYGAVACSGGACEITSF